MFFCRRRRRRSRGRRIGSWAARASSTKAYATGSTAAQLAVSGSRALVFEDGPYTSTLSDQGARVRAQRRRLAAAPTAQPPRPPTPDALFGPAIACAVTWHGCRQRYTRVSARRFRFRPCRPDSAARLGSRSALRKGPGDRAAVRLQTYPGPSTVNDIAVLQPNSSGGYDHVATLGAPYEQWSLHISGQRVVSTNLGCSVGLRFAAVIHAGHVNLARFRKRKRRVDRSRGPVRGGATRLDTCVPAVEPHG